MRNEGVIPSYRMLISFWARYDASDLAVMYHMVEPDGIRYYPVEERERTTADWLTDVSLVVAWQLTYIQWPSPLFRNYFDMNVLVDTRAMVTQCLRNKESGPKEDNGIQSRRPR